jgi:hypothetical protein
MRRRPLLRAAAVGGGAYLAGRSVARRRAGQEYQDAEQDARLASLEEQRGAVPEPDPAAPFPAGPSLMDQLSQLADLNKQGVLSDAEFAAAKAKLLST